MFTALLGALVATATPTVTPSAPKTVIVTPAPKRDVPDMATMMKMFDTFVPPQPAPDPARLVMAHSTALALLPQDSLGKAARDMMGGLYDRMMKIRPSDLPFPKQPAPKTSAADRTMRESMAAKDPHFAERERLTRAAVEVEFMRLSAIMEPRLRDGIARAVARRFDQRQLTDINAFFATPSGKALSGQLLGLWFDPDLMRSTMAGMPEMIQLMPGSIDRIQAATAHLPKPPKPTPPKPPRRMPAPKPKPARS
jgi:hypothetical protein